MYHLYKSINGIEQPNATLVDCMRSPRYHGFYALVAVVVDFVVVVVVVGFVVLVVVAVVIVFVVVVVVAVTVVVVVGDTKVPVVDLANRM